MRICTFGEGGLQGFIPDGGVDTNIRFCSLILIQTTPLRLVQTISGGLADYSVQIPPQDANQDYNSFLMYIVERDQSVMVKDIEVVMYGDGPTEPMDTDGDGVPDDEDAFPDDPAASVDADMDGLPDAWNDGATQEEIDASELTLDNDDDNDGYTDEEEMADVVPSNPQSTPVPRSIIPFLVPLLSSTSSASCEAAERPLFFILLVVLRRLLSITKVVDTLFSRVGFSSVA